MLVLGVKVESYSVDEALRKIEEFFSSSIGKKIFTVNPEMVVCANSDEYFRSVLNAGDINTCDGFGLRLFFGLKRLTGVDLMQEVCGLSTKLGKSIFLLGSGNETTVACVAENLKKQYPGLKIAGIDKGPVIADKGDKLVINELENCDLIKKINNSGAEILFVAFGMGKQEKWIHENLLKIPTVKIAMGVGGSFEFISGEIKRAPLFLRQIGLEWMYRLARQPGRIFRIINATVVFSWLAIKYKIYGKN